MFETKFSFDYHGETITGKIFPEEDMPYESIVDWDEGWNGTMLSYTTEVPSTGDLQEIVEALPPPTPEQAIAIMEDIGYTYDEDEDPVEEFLGNCIYDWPSDLIDCAPFIAYLQEHCQVLPVTYVDYGGGNSSIKPTVSYGERKGAHYFFHNDGLIIGSLTDFREGDLELLLQEYNEFYYNPFWCITFDGAHEQDGTGMIPDASPEVMIADCLGCDPSEIENYQEM